MPALIQECLPLPIPLQLPLPIRYLRLAMINRRFHPLILLLMYQLLARK
jgi:hypothetical protein